MSKRTIERDGFILTVKRVPDEDPDLSYLEQSYEDCSPEEQIECQAQDAKRRAAYGVSWWMLGITVDVAILTATNWATPPIVGRASLWGIESDSEESYLSGIEEDLISEALQDAGTTHEALNARALKV